jgi:hypothetical protein
MDTPAASSPVGRPKGEPSTVVNIRLPLAVVEKLDRYCDRMTTHTGPPTNRATITRQALVEFLERHAPDII